MYVRPKPLGPDDSDAFRDDALVRGVTSKAPTVVLLQIPGAAPALSERARERGDLVTDL